VTLVPGPNTAFALLIAGVLAIYWELLRPGFVFPLVAGGACVLTSIFSLRQNAPTASGLELLGLAIVLFCMEERFELRTVPGIAGTAALTAGSLMLFTGARTIAPYIGIPLSLVFGGVTTWLAAAAKRARRNKRRDLTKPA
jgi:membrane-bound serine protease (ClpP class)